ncbi:hypothetical protein [Paenibacillus thiaminolyticus]|uniref:Uncharacterized protein n=1 Tax=Paenibacillus thiaminolyticus TaxID=49283 RepID=A0A3A3GDN5_PANTH|nr:hypothetical protein [Paenibacillus thiaminolyticus]RJG21378.1 hypothetical protein DQX05_22020 [Paenibacillus thiaminolyticus]
MGVVVPFKRKKSPGIRDLFDGISIDKYYQHFESANEWLEHKKEITTYFGYPEKPPIAPPRKDMNWYVDVERNFGVWVLNTSKKPLIANHNLVWGWSPFIRKTTAPVHEPLHLENAESRVYIAWIVDKDGYGQYGTVDKLGQVWIPHPRPHNWIDHNHVK